jgi:AcrR family transcriptional regulator
VVAVGDEDISIWMRPERRSATGPRPGFSRARIAEVAIKIADAEGLEAASMRRIAAELGTGAMSLYRYVPKRDDLIELMVDAVVAETDLPEHPTGQWRDDLTRMAHESRSLRLRHHWFAGLMTGRPVWGPNSLRFQEFLFGALAETGLSVDEIMVAVTMLRGYVSDFVGNEIGWRQETERTGMNREEWMAGIAPFVKILVDSDDYPMLARIITESRYVHIDADARFQYGLDRVLDGIEAILPE